MATLDRIQAEADLEEFVERIPEDAVFMPPASRSHSTTST